MRGIFLQLLGVVLLAGATACSDKETKLIPRPDPRLKKEEKIDLGQHELVIEAKVDILFVIDDSGSMGSHQTTLANNIDRFVQGIFKTPYVDYHIGVVSTDVDKPATAGVLRGNPIFVDRNTPNGQTVLQANLKIGTSGSGTEATFQPIISALTEPNLSGVNHGFYRKEAFLSIVSITDAEDQSASVDAKGTVDFLKTLKGTLEKILVYGVYYNPLHGFPSCARDTAGLPNNPRLDEFFTLLTPDVMKSTFSLCDPAYGDKLAAIGEDLYNRVAKRVPLDIEPDEATIRLYYGKQEVPNDPDKGWVYEPFTNSLIFGRQIDLLPEPEGTTFRISFLPAKEL